LLGPAPAGPTAGGFLRIPLFATDEPADIAGASETTILVRRVKQDVAEWYRLKVKASTRKGLETHALAGYQNGRVLFGYLPDRIPHPAPLKAAQGRTKTRLAADPDTGPWVTQMFTWRVAEQVSYATIAGRLDALGVPSPDGGAWSPQAVGKILANPKYTGHMVYGRTRNAGKSQRKGERKVISEPREKWIWSPEPVHPALVSMELWEAAQKISPGHERVRDAGKPAKNGRRLYPLRSRVICHQCQRRMTGGTRDGRRPGQSYTYYTCPHRPANPRHATTAPAGHVRAAVREETLTAAIAGFLDDHVFGDGRAAHLAAVLPASAAGETARRMQQIDTVRKKLARYDAQEKGLMTELADQAGDTSPAAAAYRARIRIRQTFKDIYDQRTAAQAVLDALLAAPATENDPTLLDELPYAAGFLASAPDTVREQLYAALDLYCLYRADKNQATIWVTLTGNTPGIIKALLADPRTDTDTGWTLGLFGHLGTAAIASETRNKQVVPPERLAGAQGLPEWSAGTAFARSDWNALRGQIPRICAFLAENSSSVRMPWSLSAASCLICSICAASAASGAAGSSAGAVTGGASWAWSWSWASAALRCADLAPMLAAVPATTAVVAIRAMGRRRRIGMSIASCCLGAVGGVPSGANDAGLPISVESVGQGVHGLFDDLARDSCAFEDYPVCIAHCCRERARPDVLPDEQRC
jgi:site-specific DNA recombinase